MTADLICVPPNCTATFFPAVRDMLDKGFAEADELFPAETYDRLAAGEWLLWIAVSGDAQIIAAMLTRLYFARSGKVCQILCCGGERVGVWKHHMAAIEDYARAEGCVRILAEGRKGWLRLLNGFRSNWVKFEKVL